MLTHQENTVRHYNTHHRLWSSFILTLILSSMVLFSSGCMYRIDIQQGNVVNTKMLQKLRQGMTQQQVIYVLGTPLLQDVFHQDRWDYYFSLKPGKGSINHWFNFKLGGGGDRQQTRLQLYFKEQRLQKITGDADLNLPELKPFDGQMTEPNQPLL